MNLKGARRVSGAHAVFVVPGRDVTCLVTAGGGPASCTPDEYVGRDFQVQTCGQLPKGVVSVSGLVLDSVESAVIRSKGGSAVPLRVERNYGTTVLPVTSDADVPVAVELKSAAGTTSVPVPAVSLEQTACAGLG